MTTTAPAAVPHQGRAVRPPPRRAQPWRLPLALAALGAVLHLAYVWMQPRAYVLGVDDSYYYFQIARNAAAGHGFTFDGLHPTNGFQPLWGYLLTGAAWVFARLGITESVVLARWFLTVTVLVNVAAGLALYAAARAWLGRRRDAVGALTIWLLSPLLVEHQTFGMENALFALLLAGAVAVYHRGFGDADRPPSPARAAALGILLGLLAITRLDAAIFAAVVIPVIAWRMRRMPPRPALARLAPLCVLAALPMILYLGSNLVTFGHAMPVSGEAKSWYSARVVEAAGGVGSPGHLRMLAVNCGISLLWLQYVAAGPILLAYGWLHPLYTALLSRAGLALMVGAPFASAALGAVLAGWIARGRGAARVLRARLRPLLRPGVLHAFALLQFCAFAAMYPRYIAGGGPGWYFVPLYVLVVLMLGTAGAFAVQGLRMRFPRARRWIGPAVIAALAVNFAGYRLGEGRAERLGTSRMEIVDWASENLPPDARIGSYNAGAIGFFAKRPVINLDGLANDYEFLEFVRTDRIEAYARREGITHLLDYDARGRRPQGRWRKLPVGRVIAENRDERSSLTYYVVEMPWAAPARR